MAAMTNPFKKSILYVLLAMISTAAADDIFRKPTELEYQQKPAGNNVVWGNVNGTFMYYEDETPDLQDRAVAAPLSQPGWYIYWLTGGCTYGGACSCRKSIQAGNCMQAGDQVIGIGPACSGGTLKVNLYSDIDCQDYKDTYAVTACYNIGFSGTPSIVPYYQKYNC